VVTDNYTYDAYGEVIEKTGNTTNDYLYRGEQSDSDTGLQYLRARNYDTNTGRFISTDPFEGVREVPISRHQYTYGNANPISFTDPSGYFSAEDVLLARILLGYLSSQTAIYQIATRSLRDGKRELEWKGTVNAAGISFSNLLFPVGYNLMFLETHDDERNEKVLADYLVLTAEVISFTAPIFKSLPFSPSPIPFSYTIGNASISTPTLFGAKPDELTGPYNSFTPFSLGIGVGGGYQSVLMGSYGMGKIDFTQPPGQFYGVETNILSVSTGISILINDPIRIPGPKI
jgi:RHS repeat-associated protein